jgi:hypothetical protein
MGLALAGFTMSIFFLLIAGVCGAGCIHTDKPEETKLVIANIGLSSKGGIYTLTGDVNNAGLLTAKSAVISTGAPAVPVAPYPDYTLGDLKRDDFSSFMLTFTTNDLSSVPVEIHWTDEKGNPTSYKTTLDLRNVSVQS